MSQSPAIVEEDEAQLEETGLDPQRLKLARLLAEGELSTPQIADELGVSRITAWRWSSEPAVKAKVRDLSKAVEDELFRVGLARRHKRVEARARVANHLFGQILSAKRSNPAIVREWNALLDAIARETGTQNGDFTEPIGAPPIREVRIFLTEDAEASAKQSEYEASLMVEGEARPYEPTETERKRQALAEREAYRASFENRGR